MSHLANHSQFLAVGLGTIPLRQRKIRLAVGNHLARLRYGGARDLVRRLRRLSIFMRMGRDAWPKAVDRLFSMDYEPAENTIARYRKWVKSKPWSADVKKHANGWGFLVLSRDLNAQGLIPWQLKHVRTQAQIKDWERVPKSFRAKAHEWLRLQELRNLSPLSMIRFRYELLSLGIFIGAHRISYKHLKYDHALTWLEKVRNSGLSAYSFNHRLNIAKRFYSWLQARKIIENAPFETFRSIRLARKLPRIMSEREVLRLLKAARPGRQRAVLELLYASGCRVSELCKLDLAKVSFREKTARTVGKGGHETIIYLNDSALEAIRSYLPVRQAILRKHDCEREKALFLNGYGNRITTFAVRGLIVQVADRVRIGRAVTPHMFRYAFATHLLNRGADLFSLMQFLGHKNIQSTVRYLQVATTRLSQVHRKYHPRR